MNPEEMNNTPEAAPAGDAPVEGTPEATPAPEAPAAPAEGGESAGM